MLGYVGVGPVKDRPLWGEPIVLEDKPELAADLSVPWLTGLPTGPPDRAYEGIDLLDDVFDHHGHVGRGVLLQDLGESALVGVEDRELVQVPFQSIRRRPRPWLRPRLWPVP